MKDGNGMKKGRVEGKKVTEGRTAEREGGVRKE